MKTTLKILKNNIFTIFVLVIFVIGMIILTYFVNMYMGDDKSNYAQRIENIDNYPISDNDKKETIEKIKANEKVIDVTYDVSVRSLVFMITVTDETTKEEAKKIGNDIVTYFDDDYLAYYTIDVTIDKKNDKLDDFPIQGTRHHYTRSQIEQMEKEGKKPNELSWTKDREVSSNEDEDKA